MRPRFCIMIETDRGYPSLVIRSNIVESRSNVEAKFFLPTRFFPPTDLSRSPFIDEEYVDSWRKEVEHEWRPRRALLESILNFLSLCNWINRRRYFVVFFSSQTPFKIRLGSLTFLLWRALKSLSRYPIFLRCFIAIEKSNVKYLDDF